MAELPPTGGCLCGAVRFELTAPLQTAGYCHCTRCQRRTGTGSSANARAAPGSLRVTQGEELVHAFDPGDGGALKMFCSQCGSALWSRNPQREDEVGIRLGALDRDPHVTMSYRQFVAYAAAWEPIPDDGLPRFDERRPSQL